MTSNSPWDPHTVSLGQVTSKTLQSNHSVIASTTILADIPHCQYFSCHHIYQNPMSDEALLHSIEPSLIDLNTRLISTTTSIHEKTNQHPE